MKKYAIDCTHFIKGEVGGFESYLQNLLTGISVFQKDKITLFVLSHQVQYFRKFEDQFILCSVAASGRYQRIFWQNFILPFYSFQFDVMLFPANFRPAILFCRSVTVIHDLQYIYFPHFWSFGMLLYRKIFIPVSLYRSTQVITISESVKKEILDHFKLKSTPINVIYNPISIFKSSPAYREIGDGKRYVLIPSSLAPHKNISALVSAIDDLQDESDKVNFIFIGPFKPSEFKIEYKSDVIQVLGYVDTNVKDSLFYYCSAIIIPSLYEGFGMPYIEAVLNKKPILVCDIPVAREILGNYASYIHAPFDENEIKSALNNFLSKGMIVPSDAYLPAVSHEINPESVGAKYLNIMLGSTTKSDYK